MVNTGLSEVIGSWMIKAILLPRTLFISLSESRNKSCPSSSILPDTIRPGGIGISRISDSIVTDLPEPDSPDNAQSLAAAQVKADAVHRFDRAPAGLKISSQPVHFQDDLAANGRSGSHNFLTIRALIQVRALIPNGGKSGYSICRSRGSSLSRSQSPNRFSDNTVSTMAMPGNVDIHHDPVVNPPAR